MFCDHILVRPLFSPYHLGFVTSEEEDHRQKIFCEFYVFAIVLEFVPTGLQKLACRQLALKVCPWFLPFVLGVDGKRGLMDLEGCSQRSR